MRIPLQPNRYFTTLHNESPTPEHLLPEGNYQRVICLSVTSETRHDTRDQRESLRGRAPLTKTAQILKNFAKFIEILEKICTSQKSMRFESL